MITSLLDDDPSPACASLLAKIRVSPIPRALAIAVVGFFCGSMPMMAAPVAFHPQRILIMPREGVSLRQLDQLHARGQRRITREFREGLQLVTLKAGQTVEEAISDYRASGLVQFAEPDYAISAASVLPSDPRFQDGTQWGLNNYGQAGGTPDADIDAPEAWDIRSTAPSVVVAIVDTGVQATHEDLAGNLWSNPLDGTPGFNALTGGHDPWDDNGHGTHLAGIIGAMGDNGKGVAGVAWHVRLMICKSLDSLGDGFNSDAIACMEFARTNGAQIINLSWGGPDFSAALSNEIRSARSAGILVVAAAGNNARNTDLTPFYPAGIALDNIVAVGASTRQDGVWFLSNYGSDSVDLFAPGAAIYSTALSTNSNSTYMSRDGSSMASAWVAGAAALLRGQEPSSPVPELIQRLLAAVDRAPAFAGKCVSEGRLNLRKALDQPGIAITNEGPPFALRVSGAPSHSYVVSTSTNLTSWIPLRTNLADSFGEWTFADGNSTNAPLRFYRAMPGP